MYQGEADLHNLNVLGVVFACETQSLRSKFLIFTFAAPPVFLQDVPFRAGTLEASLRVFADEVARFGGLITFIEI